MDEFYLNSEQMPKNLFADIFKKPFAGYYSLRSPSKFVVKYMKQNLTVFSCGDTMTIDLKTRNLPPILVKEVCCFLKFFVLYLWH
jgi:hypothetical protein